VFNKERTWYQKRKQRADLIKHQDKNGSICYSADLKRFEGSWASNGWVISWAPWCLKRCLCSTPQRTFEDSCRVLYVSGGVSCPPLFLTVLTVYLMLCSRSPIDTAGKERRANDIPNLDNLSCRSGHFFDQHHP
jgi:hypothetical protein